MQFSLRYLGLWTIAVAAGLVLGGGETSDFALGMQGTAAVMLAAILISPRRNGLAVSDEPNNIKPRLAAIVGWTLLASLVAYEIIDREYFGKLPNVESGFLWLLGSVTPSCAWSMVLLAALALLRTQSLRTSHVAIRTLAAFSIVVFLAIGQFYGSTVLTLVHIAIRGIRASEPGAFPPGFTLGEVQWHDTLYLAGALIPLMSFVASALLLALRRESSTRLWWTLFLAVITTLLVFDVIWFIYSLPILSPEYAESSIIVPWAELVGTLLSAAAAITILAMGWATRGPAVSPAALSTVAQRRPLHWKIGLPVVLILIPSIYELGRTLVEVFDLTSFLFSDLEMLLYLAFTTETVLPFAIIVASAVLLLQILRRRAAPFEQLVPQSAFAEAAAIITLLMFVGIPAVAYFGMCVWMGPFKWPG